MGSKIKNIIKAYSNPTPDEEWYKERLDTCKGCEFNSENVDYKDLSAAHKIQKRTNTAPDGFCTLCSCPVDKKTSVKAEYCALKKIGKTPKWDQMEVESAFGFTVETYDESIPVTKDMSENLVDLGKVGGKDIIEFKVAVNYNDRRYHLNNTKVSCGCVTMNIEEENKGQLVVSLKVNTLGFSEGVNTKRVVFNFKSKNNKEYPTIIKIKTEK